MARTAEQLRPYQWQEGQSGNPRGRPKKPPTGFRARLLSAAEGDLRLLSDIASMAIERAEMEEAGKDVAALLTVASDAVELKLAYGLGKPWDGRPEDLDRQDDSEQEPAAVLAMPPLVQPAVLTP